MRALHSTVRRRLPPREGRGPALYRTRVDRDEPDLLAFEDINPQAPVHVLVIPRKAIAKLADAGEEDGELLGQLMLAAGKVARQLGVADAFRLIVNNGEGAGQTVFHLHLHIIAGRSFTEGRMVG